MPVVLEFDGSMDCCLNLLVSAAASAVVSRRCSGEKRWDCYGKLSRVPPVDLEQTSCDIARRLSVASGDLPTLPFPLES